MILTHQCLIDSQAVASSGDLTTEPFLSQFTNDGTWSGSDNANQIDAVGDGVWVAGDDGDFDMPFTTGNSGSSGAGDGFTEPNYKNGSAVADTPCTLFVTLLQMDSTSNNGNDCVGAGFTADNGAGIGAMGCNGNNTSRRRSVLVQSHSADGVSRATTYANLTDANSSRMLTINAASQKSGKSATSGGGHMSFYDASGTTTPVYSGVASLLQHTVRNESIKPRLWLGIAAVNSSANRGDAKTYEGVATYTATDGAPGIPVPSSGGTVLSHSVLTGATVTANGSFSYTLTDEGDGWIKFGSTSAGTAPDDAVTFHGWGTDSDALGDGEHCIVHVIETRNVSTQTGRAYIMPGIYDSTDASPGADTQSLMGGLEFVTGTTKSMSRRHATRLEEGSDGVGNDVYIIFHYPGLGVRKGFCGVIRNDGAFDGTPIDGLSGYSDPNATSGGDGAPFLALMASTSNGTVAGCEVRITEHVLRILPEGTI